MLSVRIAHIAYVPQHVPDLRLTGVTTLWLNCLPWVIQLSLPSLWGW